MNAIRKSISRRDMLKGSAVIGGASMLSFSQLFGFTSVFAQDGDDPQTILNLAATAETLACTHYHAAIVSGGIAWAEAQLDYLKAGLDAELQHLEFLNANGGASLVSEFYVPQNVFTDVAVFSLVTETAETAFVAAYLAAARRIAELGDPLLAATAAQVAVVEAQHLALVRQIGGRLPNHISIGVPLFTNVSNAVPVLQPFLEGGDGFEGPAAYPGAEAIRAVIGDKGVRPVQPFTAIGAEMMAMNEMAGSMTAMAGTISSSASAVNVRSGPGTSFAVVTTVASGGAIDIMARNTDSSWLMVSANGATGWISSSLIAVSGDISTLAVQ